MGLDFKDDDQIAKLLEKVENADHKKTDAANFSKLLREMVEEALDEQSVKFRFEEDGYAPESLDGYVNEADRAAALGSACGRLDKSMRFEWVVIETARMAAGAPPAVPTSLTGQLSALEKAVSKNERQERSKQKKIQKLQSEIDEVSQLYLCARGPWRVEDDGKTLTREGEQAATAIAAAKASGYFSDADFANATMEGVGKAVPFGAEKGKIEVKTDVMFGSKRISLKMEGMTQAASAESTNTKRALEAALATWLDEHAQNSIKVGKELVTRGQIEELFAPIGELMSTIARGGRISGQRGTQILKALADFDKIEAEGGELTPKEQQKREKYEQWATKLENHGIISRTGENAGKILNDSLNFDTWKEETGKALEEALHKLFTSFAAYDAEGNQKGLSLQSALVDELLTGRGLFGGPGGGQDHAAVAQYILTPKNCYTLVKTERGYEDTIKTFSSNVKLRISAKSGRPFKFGTDENGNEVVEKTIGVSPSYRFDITPKHIEAVVEKATENAQKKLEAAAADVDTEVDTEKVAQSALEDVKKAVKKLLKDAIDEDAIADSMKSEDLT